MSQKEIEQLRAELDQLREYVARLEQQMKTMATAVSQIDAEGVTDSLMAGIIEGDVHFNNVQVREPALKPNEWEFLRILVEADKLGQIEDSCLLLLEVGSSSDFMIEADDEGKLSQRLEKVGMPISSGLNNMASEGLLRLEMHGQTPNFVITRQAWDAADRHFPIAD